MKKMKILITTMLGLSMALETHAMGTRALQSEVDRQLLRSHVQGCSQQDIARVQSSIRTSLIHPQAATIAKASLTQLARQACSMNHAQTSIAAAPSALVAADLTAANASQIRVSGENAPHEDKTKAFDNTADSKWLSFSASAWIAYDLQQAARLSSYSITSANDEARRDPRNWKLEGSNDGSIWVSIDSQSNQTFSQRKLRRVFNISPSTSYKQYRLNIVNNNGANETQLAEMELIGSFDVTPTNETILKNGIVVNNLSGAKDSVKKFRIDVPNGQKNLQIKTNGGTGDADLTVKFGSTPGTTTGSYDCKSEGGTNVESCVFAAPQVGSYFIHLRGYSAYSGATIVASFESAGCTTNCSNWNKPTVEFINDLSPGGLKFNQLVPDVNSYIATLAENVQKTIYHNASEVPAFSTLELRIERWNDDPNGVAWKAGDPPRIIVNVNAYHLERIAAAGGNVAEEVRGVLFHEMTHAYQFSTGTDLPAIEGLADTVRYLNGYIPTSFRQPGGSWTDSYKTTAFFFAWIKERKGFPDFPYCFNQQSRPGNSGWTWDKALGACTSGATTSALWNEYQQWLRSGAL